MRLPPPGRRWRGLRQCAAGSAGCPPLRRQARCLLPPRRRRSRVPLSPNASRNGLGSREVRRTDQDQRHPQRARGVVQRSLIPLELRRGERTHGTPGRTAGLANDGQKILRRAVSAASDAGNDPSVVLSAKAAIDVVAWIVHGLVAAHCVTVIAGRKPCIEPIASNRSIDSRTNMPPYASASREQACLRLDGDGVGHHPAASAQRGPAGLECALSRRPATHEHRVGRRQVRERSGRLAGHHTQVRDAQCQGIAPGTLPPDPAAPRSRWHGWRDGTATTRSRPSQSRSRHPTAIRRLVAPVTPTSPRAPRPW